MFFLLLILQLLAFVHIPQFYSAKQKIISAVEVAQHLSPQAHAYYLQGQRLIDKVCQPEFFTHEKLKFFAERQQCIDIEIPQLLEKLNELYPTEVALLKNANFDHVFSFDKKKSKHTITGFHYDPYLVACHCEVYSMAHVKNCLNGVIKADMIFEPYKPKYSSLFPAHWDYAVILEHLVQVLKYPDEQKVEGATMLLEKEIENVRIRIVLRNNRIITFYPL